MSDNCCMKCASESNLHQHPDCPGDWLCADHLTYYWEEKVEEAQQKLAEAKGMANHVDSYIWLARFSGHFIGGYALVRAKDRAQARRRVVKAATAHGLTLTPTASAIDIEAVCVATGAVTDMWARAEDPNCYIVDNGDY